MNISSMNFTKLFEEQKQLSSSKRVYSSETWDKKASYMDKRVKHSIYNEAFINKMSLEECESLLDFGCGTGNISLAIADKFCDIYAIDYSKGMLDAYTKNAKEKNLENITTLEKSIDENWVDIPTCDIVVASRSIYGVADIKSALLKLNEYANKRVYLTYKTNFGFYDKRLYEALGRVKVSAPDYIYVINILYSLGIYASVDFIPAESKYEKETTYEIFLENVIWELGKLNKEELEKLEAYFDEHVKEKDDKPAHWALISWEKIN